MEVVVMSFFRKHKVFIAGLVLALCTALAEFTTQPVIDWSVIGYAGFIAVGSYLVKNARGQWITIAGIILGAVSTIWTTIQTGGEVNTSQLLLTVAIQIGLAAASPIKDRSYEESTTIKEAKGEAAEIEQITPKQAEKIGL